MANKRIELRGGDIIHIKVGNHKSFRRVGYIGTEFQGGVMETNNVVGSSGVPSCSTYIDKEIEVKGQYDGRGNGPTAFVPRVLTDTVRVRGEWVEVRHVFRHAKAREVEELRAKGVEFSYTYEKLVK